jgi:hypothetical protein
MPGFRKIVGLRSPRHPPTREEDLLLVPLPTLLFTLYVLGNEKHSERHKNGCLSGYKLSALLVTQKRLKYFKTKNVIPITCVLKKLCKREALFVKEFKHQKKKI